MSEFDRELQRELQPGEKIIWSGNPVRVWSHLRPAMGIFFFGLSFTAMPAAFFASYFGYLDIPIEGGRNVSNFTLIIFMMPFLYFGITSLLAPLFALIKMNDTVYGVSNRRVIIISKILRRRVHSWRFETLNGVSRQDFNDGIGDVIFASEWISDGEGGKSEKTYGFLGVRDARNVELIIAKATKDAHIEDGA